MVLGVQNNDDLVLRDTEERFSWDMIPFEDLGILFGALEQTRLAKGTWDIHYVDGLLDKLVERYHSRGLPSQLRIYQLRLRQFAVAYKNIESAISRTLGYPADFSPSSYTPSRTESLKAQGELLERVCGYCLAVDDTINRSHGSTLARWWDAIERGLTYPEPFDIPDNDSGSITAVESAKASEADMVFGKCLWEGTVYG